MSCWRRLLLANSTGDDVRLAGAVFITLAHVGAPLLLVFCALWFPVLLVCKNGSYQAREWAVLLAPTPIVAAVLIWPLVIEGPHAIEPLSFMAVAVFTTPIMMMFAALFLYFDRKFWQLQSRKRV